MEGMSQPIVLKFTPDNPFNTTITTTDGDVCYRVVTGSAGDSLTTHVRNADDELIGGLAWRDNASDRVILRGREPMDFSQWMKKSHLPCKQ
jgi:hypothetical protein